MNRSAQSNSCRDRSAAGLNLEFWPVGRLVPSARNARTHSDAQIAEIAGSIRAFGFTNPILAGEDGDVIAGHGRLAAARLLGLTEVPVIQLRGLSELQRRQLMLADNRIALNAGWDLEMLRLELRDLSALGADLSVLGFTAQELAAALSPASAGLTDENEIPEVVETAVARLGDIWSLGSHRLTCGDSTDSETVKSLLGDHKPQLMVTDPPYGVDYDPAWRHRAGVNRSKRLGKVKNDERADWGAAWALFPGSIAYVWHGALHAATVAKSLIHHGFAIRAQIIWAKQRLVIGRGDYHWQHEPCWYAVRKKGNWTGDRKQTTLWTIPSGGQDTDTVHGTQKPVECMRRAMLNNSSPGQAVYDPFLGSGTTLIAAQTTGRSCLALELEPLYVDVAIRRWQAFTGEQATLLADGRPFDAIAAERQADTKPAGTKEAKSKSSPTTKSKFASRRNGKR
jgi:DNA modification methylase